MEMLDILFMSTANFNACANATIIRIIGLVRVVMQILYIAVPILIVLWGTFDLLKAVVANDDKQMNDAWKMVMKRLIYGVAIFLLGVVTHMVLGVVVQNEIIRCQNIDAGFTAQ